MGVKRVDRGEDAALDAALLPIIPKPSHYQPH